LFKKSRAAERKTLFLRKKRRKGRERGPKKRRASAHFCRGQVALFDGQTPHKKGRRGSIPIRGKRIPLSRRKDPEKGDGLFCRSVEKQKGKKYRGDRTFSRRGEALPSLWQEREKGKDGWKVGGRTHSKSGFSIGQKTHQITAAVQTITCEGILLGKGWNTVEKGPFDNQSSRKNS